MDLLHPRCAGLAEPVATQGPRVGMQEEGAYPTAQALQGIGGQAAKPGVQRQGVLQEAGLGGIAAALVVARGGGVDEGVMKQDSIPLLDPPPV